jgi:curli biogenesis system outer membrane secretion channel CsgG
MRKIATRVLMLLFVVSLLPACVDTLLGPNAKVTQGLEGQDINATRMDAYNGPKARIAVARFENKASGNWYNHQIGDGMADMLATALVNSNRFIVLERKQLGDILGEQNLGASGRVSQATAARIGKIEGAEILVVAAVTEFEDNASGGSGSGSNIFGAIAGALQSTHMAIDLRLIDTTTSRVLAATSVEGSAKNLSVAALGRYFGGSSGTAALAGWKNTPKEKALRAVIIKAVEFIVTKTPRKFYRHK